MKRADLPEQEQQDPQYHQSTAKAASLLSSNVPLINMQAYFAKVLASSKVSTKQELNGSPMTQVMPNNCEYPTHLENEFAKNKMIILYICQEIRDDSGPPGNNYTNAFDPLNMQWQIKQLVGYGPCENQRQE